MKKTLLITSDFYPRIGGVATYWNRVCSSLETDKLVILTNVDNAKHQSCNVIVADLFFKWFWPKWLKGVAETYKVYKAHNCEQIVVGQVLPIGSIAYLLHKLFKIPYIVQIYGMDLMQASQHPRKKRLAKLILKNANHIIVNSHAVGKVVKKFGVSDDRLSVVYPIPADLPVVDEKKVDALKKKYDLENSKIILTIGRLVKRKGVDKTLGAMMHIWQRHPDAVYVIVGDGEERENLEEMAAPHDDHVIFTGKVSDEERNTWLASCDVFIMPARQTHCDIEGFGIVYLEAHQYSKPVIAGNVGGCVEAVKDGETGLLVDPEDIDAIAEAAIRLLDDTDFSKQLGEQGKKRLTDDFDWGETVKTFKEQL